MRRRALSSQDNAGLLPYIHLAAGGNNSGAAQFPYLTLNANGVVSLENTFVTAGTNGIVITIGGSLHSIIVKDGTGSLTPTIGVTAASGALLEDPNNIGVVADYAATVYVKVTGGAVAFRYNGTIYAVASTT